MSFSALFLRPGRGFFFLLALGLLAPVRADPTPAAGTMPEDYFPGLRPILDAALKESPSMIASALLIEQADAARQGSGVAPMLPSLGGGAQYGDDIESISGNSAATSRTKGLQYNIGLGQPLFQWGALKNQLEITKAVELIQKKTYADAYRSLATTLRRQYLGVIIDKIGLRNARYALKLSQDALAVAQEKLKGGTIAQGDIITPRMDAEGKQLRADRMEQAYQFDRRTLARTVGWKDLPDESIPLAIPIPKYSPATADALLAGLLREGARNTFQAQIDQLYIRQNELAYKIAAVRLLPKFSATAGYQVQNQAEAVAGSISQTTFAHETYYIVGNWTIFDGFATRAAKRSAVASRRYYERQLQIVTEATMDEAQNSRRTVDFSWRALNLAEQSMGIADFQQKQSLIEMKLGNISQDAVRGAQDALNQSDYDDATARAEFLSSWSEFVSTVGADPAMSKLPAHYVHDTR